MSDGDEASVLKRGPDGQAFRQKQDGSWWWQASDGVWYPEQSYRPAPPPPAPGASTPGRADRKTGAALVMAGGAAAIVGAFLPWATITAPFVGTISKAGIEGDGMFTAALGAGIGVVGWMAQRAAWPRVLAVVAFLAIVGLGGIAAFEYSNVSSAVDGMPTTVLASVGIGIYLTGAASVLAMIGWALLRKDAGGWAASEQPG
jgi:hypothetical protein